MVSKAKTGKPDFPKSVFTGKAPEKQKKTTTHNTKKNGL